MPVNDFTPFTPTGRSDLSHRRPIDIDTFLFGCCYYPEHWDAETRRDDAARMAAAGMNVVRMAEFAWDLMEPVHGTFDFSLFDETIQILSDHGIRTILCTPTATPPRWLTLMHPEILRQDAAGVPLSHGSRQHCDYGHPTFREHSRRVTRVMAEHYRDNPHVIGWQTDNEIYCHWQDDHSPATEANFQNWLAHRYPDIDALNQAWGTAFWAQTYPDFASVPTPRDQRPTYLNPSHQLDFFRFLSDTVAHFQHDQVVILREIQPSWFVFHNGTMAKTDYRGAFTADLDFLGYDVYPFFVADPATRNAAHAFNLDRTRSYSGNFLIPEHQSGPGGQNTYTLTSPEPGELRLISYRTIARGADGLLYFRWRSCRFGAEQYWRGILDHDNVPRRRYEETSRIGAELARLGPRLLGSSVGFDCAVATGDYDAREAHTTYPMSLPKPDSAAEQVHRWFYERGYDMGCCHPADNLDGVRLFIIPHWAVFDPAWIAPLTQWVEAGGTLVVGARTATRDLRNQIVPDVLPGVLRELCGVEVADYGLLTEDDGRPLPIRAGDQSAIAASWWEELIPDSGTEVLAHWDARFLAGTPAVTSRTHGRGRVIYVATYLLDDFNSFLLPILCDLTGLKPLVAEPVPGVEIVRRRHGDASIMFYLNSNDHPVTVAGTSPGRDLIRDVDFPGGDLELAPYDVRAVASV